MTHLAAEIAKAEAKKAAAAKKVRELRARERREAAKKRDALAVAIGKELVGSIDGDRADFIAAAGKFYDAHHAPATPTPVTESSTPHDDPAPAW